MEEQTREEYAMKKLVALLLVGLLVLTGCGASKPKGQDVKIGTAVTVKAKAAAPEGDKKGNFETNVYYGTVVLKDDKIAQVQIDVAQNKQAYNADNSIEPFKFDGSKKVLGDEYGMVKASKIGQEWYKQMENLETWMTGKTVAEVLAMETVEKDAAHPAVPANADLTSSVSVDVSNYLEIVKLAVENAVDVKNAATVGNVSFTTGAADKLDLTTTVAATAYDPNGKVVYSFIDAAQVTGKVENGVATLNEEVQRTKGQKKDEYGMKIASSIGKEWYEQVAAFNEYVIGKTPEEVKKGADADLKSSVTMGKTPLLSPIEVNNEKAIAIVK